MCPYWEAISQCRPAQRSVRLRDDFLRDSSDADFLDSTAYGYHLAEAANSPNVGDWLQVTFIETTVWK